MINLLKQIIEINFVIMNLKVVIVMVELIIKVLVKKDSKKEVKKLEEINLIFVSILCVNKQEIIINFDCKQNKIFLIIIVEDVMKNHKTVLINHMNLTKLVLIDINNLNIINPFIINIENLLRNENLSILKRLIENKS